MKTIVVSKKILFFIVLCFFLGLATSCFPTNSNISKGDERYNLLPELQFRITWDSYSGRGEAIKLLVNDYNQSKTRKANIVLVSGNENKGELEWLLSQENQNTVYVLPYRYIKHYGLLGMLEELSEDIRAYEALFYSDIWALNVVNDALYGVPWIGHSICLLYNEKLLAQAGVDPAEIFDLDSFVAALAMVEAHTMASGIGLVGASHNDLSWMVNQFVYGFGSSLVDTATGEITVNNPLTYQAIYFYKNVLGGYAQDGWVNDTGLDVMKLFLNQEVAFEFQGVWGLTDIYKNGRPFEVGIIVPSNLGIKAEVGPLMLSIPKEMSQENKDAAEHFMAYLISEEAQAKIMLGEYSPEHDTYYPFRLPLRVDLLETLIKDNYNVYLPFVEGMKEPSIDVPIAEWEAVKSDIYETGLHRVMKGELEIDVFLQNLENDARKVMNGGQSE